MSTPDIPASGATPGSGEPTSPGKKLDSWGEIASYLGREVRTVQRWERTEGLPVHRHEHKKKSTVYAFAGELDEWIRKRQPKEDPAADDAFAREQELSGADSPIDIVEPPPALAPAPTPDSVKTPAVGKRVVAAIFTLGILSALSLGLYRWFRPTIVGSDKIRLVVLPLVNLSGDAKQDYLSADLTDVITTQLGRLDPEHLRVIAPTSAKVMSGKPIAEIRQKLDVQYIVEGSVQPVANQIRIDIRLIQTSDEAQAGSDSFTRELSNFLRVESDVAEAVAHKILATLPAASLSANSQATPPPGHITAEAASKSSEAFLKGEILWTNRGDLKKSIALFEEAIEENPYNALAYAGLANATALIGQVPNDGMRPQEAKSKARDAAQRALKLDPRLVEAHAVLGNVAMSYDWDFPGAEKEFKTAVKLNPNYTFAHEYYAHLLMVEGRYEEALAETRQALELEPALPIFRVVKAEILYHARRYDQAMEATNAINKLTQMKQTRVIPDIYLAAIYVGLGDKDQAFHYLDAAYQERVDRLVYLNVEPMSDPLRSDPRFAQLMAKIGLH